MATTKKYSHGRRKENIIIRVTPEEKKIIRDEAFSAGFGSISAFFRAEMIKLHNKRDVE